jgi:hypothetical protein
MASTVRTTVTLDSDLAARLQEEAHRRGTPFRQVVNETLRRGLRDGGAEPATPPYQLTAHECRLEPGIDLARLNQLADELEDDAIANPRH